MRYVLYLFCLVVATQSFARVADDQLKEIESALIAEYAQENETSQIVEYTEVLLRGEVQQPIRIIHDRELATTNRILLVVLDDGARNLFLGNDDTVIVGVPMADRIKDLTPAITSDPAEGSPAWENARVTASASERFLEFIRDVLVPYAETKFGPFNHRVLFGYSLGGIFTIQALLQEPELFHSYIAGSPSLWYRYEFYEQAALASVAERDKFAQRCLIMSSGEDEPSINANARKFNRLLDGIDLPLIKHYQRNIEVDHSHNRLVSFLYGWDKIFNMDDIFPPASAVPNENLASFNKFARQWSESYSCAPFSVGRSAAAYAAYAEALVEQENWAGLRELHRYFLSEVPIGATAYPGLFGSLIRHFSKMPETDKSYWAKAYMEFMATKPRPGLAVHMINVDVLEFIANNPE